MLGPSALRALCDWCARTLSGARKMHRGKRRKPPALPPELWTMIAQKAWHTLPDIGTARLVCKRFARALRRPQQMETMKLLIDARDSRREARAAQDALNGVDEDERDHRALVRSVAYLGDSRLYVFFTLLVHTADKDFRRAIRVAGIEAMRETNKRFKDADVW